MKMNLKKMVFSLSLAMPLSLSAAIVNHGSYFQDTDTGLYWLKLTETNGRSYNDISAKFGYQQEFEGWRYATVAESEALIASQGIPAKGNACATGYTYCDTVDAAYAEQLEALILLFGDTYDIWLDEHNDTKDVAATGTGKAQGMFGIPYAFGSTERVEYIVIQDREWIDRATHTIINDRPDQILTITGGSGVVTESAPNSSIGSMLVRNTDPTIPLPDPGPQPEIEIVFDDLTPEELNLTGNCDFPFSTCGYDEDRWSAGGGPTDGNGGYPPDDFGLFVTADYDAQTRPWVRVLGYSAGDFITATDSTVIVPDPQWVFLPQLVQDVIENTHTWNFAGLIPGSYLSADDYADLSYCDVTFCGWWVDDVKLEFISENVVIDFDPWSTDNIIRPKNPLPNGFIAIMIKTTSRDSGDAYDFDAADVDSTALRVGPSMAAVAAAVQSGDMDNDGDIDYIFGFKTIDTGIQCLDRTISIAGMTVSGDPIVGHDVINPVDCEETVDIDVDPFNAANEVRPNDDYQLTVGVLGMSIADGDPVDLDATQVDPASLRFGPAETPNTLSPVIGDLDNDTHNDLLVGFSMLDSGIACGDTEMEMTGELYSGLPIEGVDSISTVDCETTGCHP